MFLFDEPLSNLDAKLRVQMRTEIKELHQNLKTTTVYVTHDQIEAMTMADRMVIMNEGQVEQIGAPLEVYDRPVNRFVAGFIGSPAMNFLEGTVQGGAVETATGVMLPLPESRGIENGRRVTYGVRPEHLALGSGTSGIAVEVSVVEPTGPRRWWSDARGTRRSTSSSTNGIPSPPASGSTSSRSRSHPPVRSRGRRAALIRRVDQRHIPDSALLRSGQRRVAAGGTGVAM